MNSKILMIITRIGVGNKKICEKKPRKIRTSFLYLITVLILQNVSIIPAFNSPKVFATSPVTHLSMIKDINLGSGNGNPYYFTNINSTVYFSSNDGVHGVELWKTDGTEVGTSIVKDINVGAGDSGPLSLVVLNNNLYFLADDGVHGVELWKTDGTEVGTSIVKDINVGAGRGAMSADKTITVFNNKLYFICDDGTHGYEICESDGTELGTGILKDINTGGGSSQSLLSYTTATYGYVYTVFNSELYFFADDGASGYELWKTDGTELGTTMVKDIKTGSSGSVDYYGFALPNIVALAEGVMFIADDGTHGFEPWFSNGTSVGTTLAKDILASGDSIDFDSPLYYYDNKVVFSATDGISGYEPWVSDGSTDGTFMLEDVNPGSSSSNPGRFLAVYLGDIYFRADDGTHGVELWKTDGTEVGTSLVADLNSGAGISYSNPIAVIFNKLILIATDSYYQDPDTYAETANFELWKTDGTGVGSVQVDDINPSGSAIPNFYTLTVNDKLYFGADDGTHGLELWSYWVENPSEGLPEDINDDGILDNEQSYVSGFSNPVSGSFSALEVNNTCSISYVNASAESSQIAADSGFDYPAGLMSFSAICGSPGATMTVTQYFYGLHGDNLYARKYNSSTNSYTVIPSATITKTTIDGQTVTKVSYHITDGGELDEDGVANGVIVDPSGPGLNVVGVPNTGLKKLQ